MPVFDFREHDIWPLDEWCGMTFARVYPDGEIPTSALPVGYIFVIEPSRRDPKYKMAAGHKQPGEDPLQTAQREFTGETGILLPTARFEFAGKWDRKGPNGPYVDILFTANLTKSEAAGMHSSHTENEGEQPEFFTVENFRASVMGGGFMRKHVDMLVECGLLAAREFA
ncbi:NUDIX hydrolase [Patescibacteria group bacterium]|nr:NUDIX hydrolase [Patescibacteria group bacterium]